jgi:RND family efflux transporter MFP subunit
MPVIRSDLLRLALRKPRTLAAVAFLLIVTPTAWVLATGSAGEDPALVARAARKDLVVTVMTSGELQAREFVQVTAPPNLQQTQVYNFRIVSIVPEGTVVKAGDVVAELDRSGIAAKLGEFTLAVQKAEAVYEQAMLDSALTLSQAREDIRNMELALEEKRLAKEQSRYEAPTVKRQTDIDLEKAERALVQGRADYKTRTEVAQAKMREVGADLERQRSQLRIVQDVMQGFTVRAPQDGMVIYVREWNGRKRTVGSQISAWDPNVATLPDLSKMESLTYVNEIDVRNVAVGQPVTLTLDADPTKQFTGRVTSVANVGEQRPNTDAKVFEVKVVVDRPDTTLRPGMTTGNEIETARIPNALVVPLEALNSENEIPFVYRQAGGGVRKQEVATGAMNEDEIVILRGLEEDDRVLLLPPPDAAGMELARLPDAPPPPPSALGDTALSELPPPPAPPSSPPATRPATPRS